jgi:hypothetical protein
LAATCAGRGLTCPGAGWGRVSGRRTYQKETHVAKVYKRMPFGSHRGKKWENVPLDYLTWCLDNLRHLRPALVRAMSAEVSRRREGAARPLASEFAPRRSS